MIEFARGPAGQPEATEREREAIEDALRGCDSPASRFGQLNVAFNNPRHFSNPAFGYERPLIQAFLDEVAQVARSETARLVVMGGSHCDPWRGHASAMFPEGWACDTYVRFRVSCSSSCSSSCCSPELQVLNSVHVFHFLVDAPMQTIAR
jgi:hypothetical protein